MPLPVVTVAGEVLVDLLLAAPPDVATGSALLRAQVGGGPANVAVGLARLGVSTRLLGRVGDDALGRLAAGYLRGEGVELDRDAVGPGPTAVAVADTTRDPAEYAFHLAATATFELGADAADGLPASGPLWLGTLAAAVEPSAPALLALARREKSDRMICYDPNIRSSLGLEREKYLRTVSEFRAEADLVKVSEDDVTWLVPDEAPEATCRRWADEGAVVALTKAAAGAAVFGPNGRYAEVPAAPVRLVDTVGAGDSFGAGLLAWLLAAGVATPTGLRALPRQGWEEALRLAVAAGAVTCGRPGADPPRRSELPASLWPD